jgi:hypothetical protein
MVQIQNNVNLSELYATIGELENRKQDFIIPSRQMSMENGIIKLTTSPMEFNPNKVMTSQIASKLQIPMAYYRRMEQSFQSLLDTNVSQWFDKMDKNFFVRGYSNEGGVSTGRALLSDRFSPLDNSNILMTVLHAIQKEKLDLEVEGCDLTEERMYVRFINPNVKVSAPKFLKQYVNPDTLKVNDAVVAGFGISNSEVGLGAFDIFQRVVALVCSNGMISKKDGYQRRHIGAQLDKGEMWSNKTIQRNLRLIESQIGDYIRYFSSEKYLQKVVNQLEESTSMPLMYPVEATKNVANYLQFSEEESRNLVNSFMKGRDTNGSGLIHAITWEAQNIGGDRRYEIEGKVLDVASLIESFDRPVKYCMV